MQQLHELKANADCSSRMQIEADYGRLHDMKLSYIERLQENQMQLMNQIIRVLGKENMTGAHTADHLKDLIDTYRTELLNSNLVNDANLNVLARTYDTSSCDESRKQKTRSRSSSREKRKSKSKMNTNNTTVQTQAARPVFLQELLDQPEVQLVQTSVG